MKVLKNNDREIRPYLSVRVNELTESLRDALRNIEEGKRERGEVEVEVERLKEEIAKERLERESVVRTVRLEMGEKGREVEVENQRKARDMIEVARREYEVKEGRMKEEMEKLRDKCERVVEERENAVGEKFHAESQVRSLAIDLDSRTRLVEKVTEDNKKLQEKVTEKEGAVFQLERDCHKAELRMASMEQGMGEQGEKERRMEELRREWGEAKDSLQRQNELLSGKMEQVRGENEATVIKELHRRTT